MGRRAVSFALLLAAALLPPKMAAALPNPTSAAGNPTIVIGVIATLSGPGALAGQDELDGVITAVRQLGGRFANQEVKVVAVDDHGSPDTALQVTQRLLEREKVDFVMTAVSQASMAAIIRTLLDSRVFILNLDAIPTDLAGAGCNPSLFDLSTPPEALHEAVGAVLTADKMHRLVVIGPDTPQTDMALAALRRTWTGEVVTVLRPRHGAATFAAELDAVRRLGPDAVYSLLTGGMGLAFVRDFAAAGLKAEIPLIGPSNGFERPLLAAMDESALDILTVSSWSPDLDQPVNRRLIADFEAEYARPVTSWVVQGYDAALLLDSAMRATNGRTGDRDAVRNALRRADFASARGTLRFDPNQQPTLALYQRRVVRDTKGRLTLELRGIALRDWHNRHIGECPMRWSEETLAAPRPLKATPASPAPAAPVAPPPPVLLAPPPLDSDITE
ncbi:ABC transporter substrate-binding protein [Magnetospirillum fulvum]|uniref:Amino acid/amide ABC transporter substrate-binding protein, HAAT family n=1 Tax=Magnetospirillum fulvum TaxID=1082 RepID=A0A1H6GSI6_MAGFU|nr:ABC transporter substrate-binding protein [Magnetospirillum fulvum]SEH25088.1 amino acid/amide ABC transporter substrate-binding protein, HAAT family [Magnetospirillum fulvum]